jgi:hypothetical protein
MLERVKRSGEVVQLLTSCERQGVHAPLSFFSCGGHLGQDRLMAAHAPRNARSEPAGAPLQPRAGCPGGTCGAQRRPRRRASNTPSDHAAAAPRAARLASLGPPSKAWPSRFSARKLQNVRRMTGRWFVQRLALWAASLSAPLSAASATEGSGPRCVQASFEVRYGNAGYDHVVYLHNQCAARASCDVSSDVNPEPIRVLMARGEKAEVVTMRGSPARQFAPRVTCLLQEPQPRSTTTDGLTQRSR